MDCATTAAVPPCVGFAGRVFGGMGSKPLLAAVLHLFIYSFYFIMLDEHCIFDSAKLVSMKFNHLRTSLGDMPNSLLNALEK